MKQLEVQIMGQTYLLGCPEGGDARLLEPLLGAGGHYEWRETAAGDAIDGWIERARRRDPDLWVIELDIPDAARFVAETDLGD